METIAIITEVAKQGTLGLLCIVILWSYRRDFYRRDEDKNRDLAERKTEKERLEQLLERGTAAILAAATATARQTDATRRLSRSIEKLEEKFGSLRSAS